MLVTMANERARVVGSVIFGMLLAHASPLCAQRIEVAPFGGYQFGGDLFEVSAGRALDIDGAPALGMVVDVPISHGLQFEALFSHKAVDILMPYRSFSPAARSRFSVDQWQGGALQELGAERVRPFLTGMFGLTRYAIDGDSETRFSVGAGGGVKLFPVPHVGVRLDGRVFATLLDAGATALACGNGTCLVALHMNVAWQAEFVAGLLVKFP
jgi:hypothetical protein